MIVFASTGASLRLSLEVQANICRGGVVDRLILPVLCSSPTFAAAWPDREHLIHQGQIDQAL
jgi:hypothetical protein